MSLKRTIVIFQTCEMSRRLTGPTFLVWMFLPLVIHANHSAKQGNDKGVTMNDTYGPTLPLPLMRYDLDLSCWRTCEDTSLWDLEMCSPTFPAWGMTHDGVLYELPTPERPILEQGSLSLPTPRAQQRAIYRRQDYRFNLEEAIAYLPTPTADHSRGLAQTQTDYQSLPNTVMDLLPTPIRSDYNTPISDWKADPIATQLRDISHLLPTPAVNDMGAGKDPAQWDAWTARMREDHKNGNGHGKSLEQEALRLLPTPKASQGGPDSTKTRPSGSKGTVNLTGALTSQRYDDGRDSPVPHQPQPSQGTTDDPDCLPFSWNG